MEMIILFTPEKSEVKSQMLTQRYRMILVYILILILQNIIGDNLNLIQRIQVYRQRVRTK